jgi:cytochrome c553
MHIKTWMAAALFALGTGYVNGQTVSDAQVRSWASACANCHGTGGVAQPGMESLAGVPKDELLKKLLDFKAGRKPATIMHQLSKGYTDDQLAALAGYYAAQKK